MFSLSSFGAARAIEAVASSDRAVGRTMACHRMIVSGLGGSEALSTTGLRLIHLSIHGGDPGPFISRRCNEAWRSILPGVGGNVVLGQG